MARASKRSPSDDDEEEDGEELSRELRSFMARTTKQDMAK